MIITCPNCTATYDLEDARFLPSGRSVRCSDCGVSWFVPAPEPIEALLPSSRIAPQPNRYNEEQLHTNPHTHHQDTSARPQDNKQAHNSLFSKRPNLGDSNLEGHIPQQSSQSASQSVSQSPSQSTSQASPQLRPKWGPMAERRASGQQSQPQWRRPHEPARRNDDQILDTDWEEISPSPQNHDTQSSNLSNAVPLSPIGEEGHKRHTPTPNQMSARKDPRESRIKIATPLEPDQSDAPGEIFASVNVQPRELERALKRVRRKAEARDKNRLTPMRIAGWASLFIVVATTLYAGYHYRNDMVRIWPGSSKVYAVVGINAKPYGLSLENINHRVALSTTGLIVEISGELHNQGEKPIAPPLLQAEALDIHGRLLSRWTFNPDQPLVKGADFVSFKTRSSAPEGIVEVVLSFAPEKSKTSNK